MEELTREDLQILIGLLSNSQVYVKDAKKALILLDKLLLMLNTLEKVEK